MVTVRVVYMSLVAFFAGCAGLKDLVPEGPVLSYAERLDGFSGERPSGVRYTGPARVDFPVLPLQIFGVRYDLDLILRSQHPDWDMHEYARITTPSGPVWLMKDARTVGKAQTIVADIDGIETWLPEVPVQRKSWPVKVDDRSTAERLDLDISYENIDGQAVAVSYQGKIPTDARPQRNSSTMGHSPTAVAAVLDLSHFQFAQRASIAIGGEPQKLVHLLGLIPFRMVLGQTQAGFSAGAFDERSTDGAVSTVHTGDFVAGAEQAWDVVRGDGWQELVQRGDLRTLTYRFLDRGDGALELVSARVTQFAVAQEACALQLAPALPDVRRPWDGVAEGRFVLDVNGQPSHGVGRYEARWEGDEVVVRLIGQAPTWLAERPVTVRVRVADGAAHVSSVIGSL